MDPDHPLTGDASPPPSPQEPETIELGDVDLPPESDPAADKPPGRLRRFSRWYGQRKKWTIPVTLLLLIIVLAAAPWSRYQAAGLVVKQTISLEITDAKASTPVSGAQVTIGAVSGTTDGSGDVTLHGVKAGRHTATISKKYYQDKQVSVLVPIMKPKDVVKVPLTATGRQVKLSVKDVISKQPLSGVNIKVSDIQAKTGSDGTATVVVPADATSEDATLDLNGYNSVKVTVKVSADSVQENNYTLTPAGKVYFLSNLSGKLDVVKTNLDGTGRQTVLAGTGKEDGRNTVLLASRDWKFLALVAARDSSSPKLYLINTNNDQMTTIDQGSDVSFTAIGWQGHYFVYRLNHNNYDSWQSNATSIKSYNADTGQVLTLVNTSASGTSDDDAVYENIWDTFLMGGSIIYTKTWYQSPGYIGVPGKKDVIATIQPDGTASRQIKTVDAGKSYISNLKLNKPSQLYFGVYNNDDSNASYYSLSGNGNVSQASGVNERDLLSSATAYFTSPSGNQAFWSEERDGKNTLFIGGSDGSGGKQIATLSSYSPYGWFTDNYLLVSKDGSELYIIPKSGIAKDSDAVKISDYYKPSQDYYYGGY